MRRAKVFVIANLHSKSITGIFRFLNMPYQTPLLVLTAFGFGYRSETLDAVK